MNKLKQQSISEVEHYNDLESTDPQEREKLIDSAYKLKVLNALEPEKSLAELMTEVASICKQLTK